MGAGYSKTTVIGGTFDKEYQDVKDMFRCRMSRTCSSAGFQGHIEVQDVKVTECRMSRTCSGAGFQGHMKVQDFNDILRGRISRTY